MIVSREFALAIFDLNDGYSLDDLYNSYSKILGNLKNNSLESASFLDLLEQCRDFLDTELILKETEASTKKTRCNIDLEQLYLKFSSLDSLLEKYDFSSIHSYAKITIFPLFKAKLKHIFNIYFSSLFHDFKEFNQVNFLTKVDLPKQIRKYRVFFVRIDFLDKTYRTIIFKNSFRCFILNNSKFTTRLRIYFKGKKKRCFT